MIISVPGLSADGSCDLVGRLVFIPYRLVWSAENA
jgi:hypothetical protein